MIANAKNKFILRSLLLAGIFCVLALPASVLGADESLIEASSSPAIVSVVTETIIPLVEATTTAPIEAVLPDQTLVSTASSTMTTTTDPGDLTSAGSGELGPVAKAMSSFAPLSTPAPSNSSSAFIAISEELSVTTETGSCTSNCSTGQTVISDELGATSSGTQSGETAISDEYSTQTIALVGQTAISAEQSATTADSGTCTDNCGSTTTVVSAEYSFTTGGAGAGYIAISDELSFTTLSDGGCTGNCGGTTTTVISDEYSFTTLNNGSTTNIAISDEQSFNTGSNPPGGCITNCGGGGGGGGGGSIIPTSTLVTTQACGLYLKKYIKFGEANDPYEVKKLQSFLIVFEGEKSLRVTGFYDRATFEAVTRFQAKYNRDVLGPWGITDSTSYVFITTKLAINNIYCGRDTANNLNLRDYYGQIEQLLNPAPVTLEPATTTVATTTVATSTAITTLTDKANRGLLALAFVGALNFLGSIPCWWWIILLLLIIILLLAIIWTMTESEDDEDGDQPGLNAGETLTVVDGASALPLSPTIEAEKEYDTLPVTSTDETEAGK